VHWVRPELVAEVKYLTWTDDNLLRQVVYEGLREDKPAAEVRRLVPHPKATPSIGQIASSKERGRVATKALHQVAILRHPDPDMTPPLESRRFFSRHAPARRLT
jgi:hypothetical protein